MTDGPRVVRHPTAAAFLEACRPFLAAHEAEHTVILGLAMAAARRATPPGGAGRPELLTVTRASTGAADRGGATLLAAILTPERGALLSLGTPEAVVVLADDLAEREPDLPGVEGEVDLAAAFVARWAARGRTVPRLLVHERLYRITTLREPDRTAPGGPREATRDDLALVAEWLAAFASEALAHEPPLDARAMAERWLDDPDRRLLLWVVDGRAVALAGSGSPTIRGVRVAPVYTPPAERGRGYGTAATAAITRAHLAEGRSEVYLFTDLANPTSNTVYRSLGFEPVIDVDRYALR